VRSTNVADQNVSSNSWFPSDEGLEKHAQAHHASKTRSARIIPHMTKGEDFATRGLLTVKEAAAWLAISPATCYRLMERGTLRSLKIGGARRVRLSDLQALITREI
jgi:excisionase family DNA binding protein